MSNGTEKKLGRPSGKNAGSQVKFKIPHGHFAYLRDVVFIQKKLGASPNDAARHILIRELDAMERREKQLGAKGITS